MSLKLGGGNSLNDGPGWSYDSCSWMDLQYVTTGKTKLIRGPQRETRFSKTISRGVGCRISAASSCSHGYWLVTDARIQAALQSASKCVGKATEAAVRFAANHNGSPNKINTTNLLGPQMDPNGSMNRT